MFKRTTDCYRSADTVSDRDHDPTLFDYAEAVVSVPNAVTLDNDSNIGVAIVLILVYVGNLVYTLITPGRFASGATEQTLTGRSPALR
jgi:hypothetical protein